MDDKVKLLEDLIDQHEKAVTKLAFTYVKDWSAAQDIAQEVFISVYQGLENFKQESTYKTWIYRITVNKCKDLQRSAYFRRNIITDSVGRLFKGKEENPADMVIKQEEMQGIAQDVFLLPVKYREVIILYYYQGLSTKEIAVLLDCKSSTVRTRLDRARNKLQAISKRRETIEPGSVERLKG
ncbi:sigma-70 family RNA polymerase sigma factor [Bacillus salacetis]|uniref:sigma-70 family RNA polymerase sigma factor n=1 Tax=Bacillus salacetis TaxID=2315464 RepID=UPI003B9F4D87